MVDAVFFAKLFLAFVVGSIVGLEREHSLREKVPIGLRDFALTAILGMLIAEFTLTSSPIYVIIGFAGIVLFAILFYISRLKITKVPGITTMLMLPVTYTLGILIAMGMFIEVATIVTLTTFLLIQKTQVHAFAASVVQNEIIDLLIFILIAFVIFPLIPIAPIEILGAKFDAYSFWLVVVFMTTISFVAHFILKYFKGRRAILVASFFGGLISSVAAMALLAKKNMKNAEKALTVGITSSGTASLLRDLLITALISMPLAANALTVMSLAGISLIYLTYHYYNKSNINETFISERPVSLTFVLEFAILFFATKIALSLATTYILNFATAVALLTGIISSASSIATIALLLIENKIDMHTAQILWVSAFIGSLLGKIIAVAWQSKKKINLLRISKPLIITAILSIIGLLITGALRL